MSILYEEENVILRISTYTRAIQQAYCKIITTAPKTFCEPKQTFDIKDPSVPGILHDLYSQIIVAY